MDHRAIRPISKARSAADLAISSKDQRSQRTRARFPFLLSRVFLGCIFVYASYDKIIHPVAFAGTVYNYQILPDVLVNPVALFLPWIELLVGLALIVGVWMPGALVICNLLLLVFFTTLVFNMARGLDIDCGCFASSTGTSPGGHMLWYLLRDGVFVLIGAYLLFTFFLLMPSKGSRSSRSEKILLRQTLAFALMTALLGFFVNQVRSDSVPIPGDWSPQARISLKFGKNILISFEEAKQKFFTGDVVFLDARTPELYQKGHIQGALNLPLAEFDKMADKVFMEFPEDTLMVTYCDGEDCELGTQLALKLKEIGYENVRVLHNGWSVWKNNQLPSQASGPRSN